MQSKLPTLGWNSWNAYHCDINSDQFLEAAQAIVDRGLRDAGYKYVNSTKNKFIQSVIKPNECNSR